MTTRPIKTNLNGICSDILRPIASFAEQVGFANSDHLVSLERAEQFVLRFFVSQNLPQFANFFSNDKCLNYYEAIYQEDLSLDPLRRSNSNFSPMEISESMRFRDPEVLQLLEMMADFVEHQQGFIYELADLETRLNQLSMKAELTPLKEDIVAFLSMLQIYTNPRNGMFLDLNYLDSSIKSLTQKAIEGGYYFFLDDSDDQIRIRIFQAHLLENYVLDEEIWPLLYVTIPPEMKFLGMANRPTADNLNVAMIDLNKISRDFEVIRRRAEQAGKIASWAQERFSHLQYSSDQIIAITNHEFDHLFKNFRKIFPLEEAAMYAESLFSQNPTKVLFYDFLFRLPGPKFQFIKENPYSRGMRNLLVGLAKEYKVSVTDQPLDWTQNLFEKIESLTPDSALNDSILRGRIARIYKQDFETDPPPLEQLRLIKRIYFS